MAQTECSVNPNATGGVDITCHAGEGTTQHITYVHVAGDYHQHKIEIQEPAASWHMGLSIQVVKNPGHCLFDAMAISLGFSSTQVFRAALFLALTKEEYFKTYYALAQKIDPNSRGSSESHFRAYLNSMQYGNEWGDYFDIQLIQQAMRCTIFTIRLDQGLIEKTVMANAGPHDALKPVAIAYNGYDRYYGFTFQDGANKEDIFTQCQTMSYKKQNIPMPHDWIETIEQSRQHNNQAIQTWLKERKKSRRWIEPAESFSLYKIESGDPIDTAEIKKHFDPMAIKTMRSAFSFLSQKHIFIGCADPSEQENLTQFFLKQHAHGFLLNSFECVVSVSQPELFAKVIPNNNDITTTLLQMLKYSVGGVTAEGEQACLHLINNNNILWLISQWPTTKEGVREERHWFYDMILEQCHGIFFSEALPSQHHLGSCYFQSKAPLPEHDIASAFKQPASLKGENDKKKIELIAKKGKAFVPVAQDDMAFFLDKWTEYFQCINLDVMMPAVCNIGYQYLADHEKKIVAQLHELWESHVSQRKDLLQQLIQLSNHPILIRQFGDFLTKYFPWIQKNCPEIFENCTSLLRAIRTSCPLTLIQQLQIALGHSSESIQLFANVFFSYRIPNAITDNESLDQIIDLSMGMTGQHKSNDYGSIARKLTFNFHAAFQRRQHTPFQRNRYEARLSDGGLRKHYASAKVILCHIQGINETDPLFSNKDLIKECVSLYTDPTNQYYEYYQYLTIILMKANTDIFLMKQCIEAFDGITLKMMLSHLIPLVTYHLKKAPDLAKYAKQLGMLQSKFPEIRFNHDGLAMTQQEDKKGLLNLAEYLTHCHTMQLPHKDNLPYQSERILCKKKWVDAASLFGHRTTTQTSHDTEPNAPNPKPLRPGQLGSNHL